MMVCAVIGAGWYRRGGVRVRAWWPLRVGGILIRCDLNLRHRRGARPGIRRVVPRPLQRRERRQVPRTSLSSLIPPLPVSSHSPPPQRIAKDVYNTYFFFALTCRLPILCMALSTVSLMAFLLAVAWTAWPTAVLVMSFVAGFLLTSQFVIFGIHRLINFIVWTIRVAWRAVVRRKSPPCPEAQLRPQGAVGVGQGQGMGQGQVQESTIVEPTMEMPVPVPYPSPSPAPVVAAPGYLTADPKAQVAQWTEEVRVS